MEDGMKERRKEGRAMEAGEVRRGMARLGEPPFECTSCASVLTILVHCC